jgi:putative lipoprotein
MLRFKILPVFVLLLFLGFVPCFGQVSAKNDSLIISRKPAETIVDKWIAPDKGLHFLGSMMTTIAGAKTLQQNFAFDSRKGRLWAAGFTFSLGVSKELWDSTKPHNKFSWKDLCADVAGMLLGGLILDLE